MIIHDTIDFKQSIGGVFKPWVQYKINVMLYTLIGKNTNKTW